MTEEDRKMLREVHAMLTRLLSKEYEQQQDMKQFCINVSANAYFEDMEEKRKNKLKNNFRNHDTRTNGSH